MKTPLRLLGVGLFAIAGMAHADSTVESSSTTTTVTTVEMQPHVHEVEPPPSQSEPNLTILPKPIPSPLHPRRRMTRGVTMGAGVYCPNFSTPTRPYGDFCAAQLRIGMDSPISDTHVALILGDELRVGGMFGFELGTPYVQLGSSHQRVAMAIRGSFDGVISKIGDHIPGRGSDGLLSFSNTYGPNISVALSPHAAFEARAAVGWTVGGFFSDHDGFDKHPVYGIACEGWLGLRFAP